MGLDFSFSAIGRLLSTFNGRDKLLLLAFSLSRLNRGVLALPAAESALGEEERDCLLQKNNALFFSLSKARRAFRFFSSIPALLALRAGMASKPWGESNQPFFLASKILLIGWPLIDHARYFVELGWYGETKDKVALHLAAYRMLCMAQIFAAMATVRRWQSGEGGVALKDVIHAACGIVATGHVGKFPGLESNDIVAGAAGTASTLMALQKSWPKQK